MPELYDYIIFISHAWSYGGAYDRLVSLLNKAPFFKYRNYSAPEDRPLFDTSTYVSTKKLCEAIDKKIAMSQVVIIISGMYYVHREWMEYELKRAVDMGKPIIALIPFGANMMPIEVQRCATRIVRWNTESIVSAIREVVR